MGGIIFIASMGPQLYRCGNAETELSFARHALASMGPQLYRCGNTAPPPSTPIGDALGLQWGRNFIVVEMLQMWGIANSTKDELQWGRNFIVAEMALKTRQKLLAKVVLQWGRNFIVAKMSDQQVKP